GYEVEAIDIEDKGFQNTRKMDYLLSEKKDYKNSLRLRPFLPEVFLAKTIELFGRDAPILLFTPYGMRFNLTPKSRRLLKFDGGKYPNITLGFSQTGDLIKKNEKKQRDGNILNAKKYFIKFFEAENEYQIQEIYDVITKNFYFALVEIEYDDKVEELFTALNNTGLNLSNADLLKSLLIRKAKTGSEEQVIQTWEKEIVEIITEARKRQTINREMDRFLIDF
ncbi:32615_t:CDS:2, partial [Racocetra persica]